MKLFRVVQEGEPVNTYDEDEIAGLTDFNSQADRDRVLAMRLHDTIEVIGYFGKLTIHCTRDA